MTLRSTTAAVVAAAALLATGQAMAKPHDVPPGQGHGHGHGNGQGHGPAKGVAYIFKGTYVDETTVDVTHGNGHVRKAGLDDATVTFDFSSARISAFDTNGSGDGDLGDVAPGDRVVVKAKLPKGDPGTQPFAARQLVDQTHPAAE